jgi:hypothetical protein
MVSEDLGSVLGKIRFQVSAAEFCSLKVAAREPSFSVPTTITHHAFDSCYHNGQFPRAVIALLDFSRPLKLGPGGSPPYLKNGLQQLGKTR